MVRRLDAGNLLELICCLEILGTHKDRLPERDTIVQSPTCGKRNYGQSAITGNLEYRNRRCRGARRQLQICPRRISGGEIVGDL